MSETSASFKRTMSHATTRVSSDIDVKRPENHQGIVSTRFNFNISQERPIAVVKTKLYTKRGKTFALSFCFMYAMMRFAEESDCCLLTWLYGAKIPCTIEKICKSTRKRYLNNSYSCYEKVKNEKNLLTWFIFNFFNFVFLPFDFFFLLLSFSLLRYLFTLFSNSRFRLVITGLPLLGKPSLKFGCSCV